MKKYQWSLEPLEAPAILPVTLAQAKQHLRINHTAEDGLIDSYIKAATAMLDGATGKLCSCLVSQKWRFNRQGLGYNGSCIDILLGNVKSVDAVRMQNDGIWSVVDPADYVLFKRGMFHSINPDHSRKIRWPDHDSAEGAIQIDFTAGEPVIDDGAGNLSVTIHPDIHSALLLMIGHLFQNRSQVTPEKMYDLPSGVPALIAGHRIPVI